MGWGWWRSGLGCGWWLEGGRARARVWCGLCRVWGVLWCRVAGSYWVRWFLVNSKQRMFVAEYQVDRNAKEAATRAGYAPGTARHTGWRLLQHPEVIKALALADGRRQDRLGIDADDLVQRLIDIGDKAFHGAPKVTREGKPVTVDGVTIMDWQPVAALRAVEDLMKHLGIAGAEQHEVGVAGDVVYTLTLDRELPEEVEGVE